MSVTRHAAWALVGVGGQQVMRFAVVIILARLLAPAEFGIVAAAQIIIAFADTFVDFGIGVGLVRAKELDPATEKSAMTLVLASSAVLAVLIVVGSGPLSSLLGIGEVKAVLPWVALAFFFNGGTGPLLQLLYRSSRFREVSMVQLVSNGLGYGAVSVTLAALGYGYWALVGGMVAQSLIQFGLAFALRPLLPSLRPSWSKLRPILHFGTGMLIANQLNTLARRGDNWVAGRFLGASALGFYSRAYSLMDLANQVPGVIFGRVLMPHFARRAHSSDEGDVAIRQFYLSQFAAAAIMLPAAVATVILARDIVFLLLGERWSPAAPVLAILGAGMYLRLGYKVSSTVSLAYGRSWQAAMREGIYAIIVIGGSLIGKSSGLTGIATAVLLALVWQYWAQTNLALRLIGGKWAQLGAAVAPLLMSTAVAGTIAAAASVWLGPAADHWLRLAAVVVSLAAGYAACLWLLRNTSYTAAFMRLPRSLFSGRPNPPTVEDLAG